MNEKILSVIPSASKRGKEHERKDTTFQRMKDLGYIISIDLTDAYQHDVRLQEAIEVMEREIAYMQYQARTGGRPWYTAFKYIIF